ncbi:hypothetical protein NLG97_g5334 [Lecanicillium saksenae]|uniref:Uncharacterized protein n=2 Tax=Lecanicillium saksenae TaxID=468837 RepID=A0ACC1QSY3_9HYPO|nr:hypothetical protein NLG97_g11290 [Lecanicillium saksenae]KAJ3492521.1 hypothetical protein NLG97_g5334 [Lecanicillium saksenae]
MTYDLQPHVANENTLTPTQSAALMVVSSRVEEYLDTNLELTVATRFAEHDATQAFHSIQRHQTDSPCDLATAERQSDTSSANYTIGALAVSGPD